MVAKSHAAILHASQPVSRDEMTQAAGRAQAMSKRAPRLAKVSRPNVSGALSRERLFSHLDECRNKSIIWMTGPPGSGKTTLTADYLDTWALDYVWYQVDQGDADVATFFYYLGQAVPGDSGNKKPLPVLSPEYLGNLPSFTRSFFRELLSRLTSPFALVFDNYQEVPAQSKLHEVIRDALAEIPQDGCVIFISRGEPPPTLARYQANQTMETVGWSDLRLTRDESDAIVTMRGHDLAEPARKQLYERTQGWAAGLVLMLEQLGKDGEVAEIPSTFTPKVIFDYLAGEIFKDLDPETQDFLLRTAYLPQLTAALARDLTDDENSADILARLTRHDYFVTVQQSPMEPVYQYHPLLRDFLLNKAQEIFDENTRSELHVKAASLLENAGQIEDTVALRVDAEDWSELRRLINENASIMLEQGRGETLESWLNELPGDMMDEDPWMLYWLGACRFPYAPRESRHIYEKAYNTFKAQDPSDTTGLLSSVIGVMDAILYDVDDLTLVDRWIEEVEEWMRSGADFPSPEIEACMTYNMYLSLAFRQPQHPDIDEWAERTAVVFQACTDPQLKMSAGLALATGFIWAGHFQVAEQTIEAMRRVADTPDVSPMSLCTLRNIEAMYYMVAGRFEDCMESVEAGLKVVEASGVTLWKNSILLSGIGGALSAGDLEAAERLIAQLDTAELASRRYDQCFYYASLAWVALLKHDVLAAYQHQKDTHRIANEMGMPFFEVLSGLTLAQILFACGDDRKGAAQMRRVRSIAKKIKNRLLEFISLTVYAQLALEHGRRHSGLNALQYAFGLGREKGFTNMLWWKPEVMAKLCAEALEEGIEVDYVKSLIRKRRLIPDEPPLNIRNWPWPYRLSTLGNFDVIRDGKTSLLEGKGHGRPIELLKVAVAYGGKDVNIDRIADALWPNIDSDYAHRSFNTTLHRLRKLLGDDHAVLLQGGQLSLNERYFWVDTWAFERAVADVTAQFKELGAAKDRPELIEKADRVLDLYDGPFLGSSGDQSWAIGTREQLRTKFLRFVADYGHLLEECGRSDRAVDIIQRGLEVDELAEGLYRQLMLCYQHLGRKAEAIEVYNRCSKTLAAGLQVEPSPETRDIYKSLVVQA